VRAQLMALVPVPTAGTGHKQEPEDYGSRDDNEPVLHSYSLWHSLLPPARCGLGAAELSAPAVLRRIDVR
jgi:hypothetical protein